MRRRDREITNRQEILNILSRADICRIALHDDEYPYIVPMNFGFEDNGTLILYFHCAVEGRKLDLIRNNNNVGFEVETDTKKVTGSKACNSSIYYKSVIGCGSVEIMNSQEDKVHGLDVLMKHYTGKEGFRYEEELLNKMVVLRLTVTKISAKSHDVKR